MFQFFQKSLQKKLLTLFLLIGFLPFLFLLFYTIFFSETKILNRIIAQQEEQTKMVSKLINNHIDNLINEVSFLSSLDVMHDIIAEDIDKRILRLLSTKANDLDLDLRFIVLNSQLKVVASTHTNNLNKNIYLLKNSKNSSGTYIHKDKLYIYSNIYASFDTNKQIGSLILEYSLDNLDLYLSHTQGIHSYITNKNKNFITGEKLPLDLDLNADANSMINDAYVVVYERLSSALKNSYIVYAVEKDIALKLLHEFISFMISIALIVFILIIFVAIKQSKKIIKPIEDLTALTDYIQLTHKYSQRVEVQTQDELATLANSFNRMLETTSSALHELEDENRLRLQRFTQLINIFSMIIQTKTEIECIDISIQEIKKLTKRDKLRFVKDKNIDNEQQHIEIYVSDFTNNKKTYFGYIELGLENFEDKNEVDFYNAIASMITLQLDKIALIQSTLFASHAKSTFISHMSHELRSPLNSIIGFSQYMINYEELTDNQIDSVGSIESSAQYLLNMITDILDIAKIEAGKVKVLKEPVDIFMLVHESYTMLQSLANEKQIEFELNYDNYDNDIYVTDPKIYKQILINLISNAIKFTQEGKVSIELYNDIHTLYVRINDTGVGISEENLKVLFNDFTQIKNATQDEKKGTGLGLSISKKLANIIDGNITLQSKGLNHGTTSLFSIKLVT